MTPQRRTNLGRGGGHPRADRWQHEQKVERMADAGLCYNRRVIVPSPEGKGEVEATFVGHADPDEAIDVIMQQGGAHRVDVGRVRDEDGTIRLLPYSQIRSAE